ncbi:MAG: hypothetical protein U9Q66_00695 [Patescibacteria group bacterium]|nr:hypothetical protein [Patescibacteria group bacterium]
MYGQTIVKYHSDLYFFIKVSKSCIDFKKSTSASFQSINISSFISLSNEVKLAFTKLILLLVLSKNNCFIKILVLGSIQSFQDNILSNFSSTLSKQELINSSTLFIATLFSSISYFIAYQSVIFFKSF